MTSRVDRPGELKGDCQRGSLAAWLLLLAIEKDTLAALRETLLPKLISGELRVEDAEPRVEAAT